MGIPERNDEAHDGFREYRRALRERDEARNARDEAEAEVARLRQQLRGAVDPCGGLREDIEHILSTYIGDEDGDRMPDGFYRTIAGEIMERIAAPPSQGAV